MSENPEPENKEPESKEPEVESKEVAEEKIIESPKVASKTSKEKNIIYIGNKPPMDYVMAVITAFNMGNGTEVTLKARGRAISTCVDVAEITRNRFLKDAKIRSISLGTEELTPREGGNPRNVSTLEICVKK